MATTTKTTMSAAHVGRSCLYRRPVTVYHLRQTRPFSHTRYRSRQKKGEGFFSQLGPAWRNTKIEWKPIPVALGVAFLGAFQFLRIRRREREMADAAASEADREQRAPRRERIRPSGGWQVQIMSTLPLKALSRVWGRFNELNIPYYLRVPGFKLYGYIFGVNFDEIQEPDLHNFPNLAAFFYRTLKPGLRPIDPNPEGLVSPADAKVLQFGAIEHGEVEQVKGMTYSLDALLGKSAPTPSGAPNNGTLQPHSPSQTAEKAKQDTKKRWLFIPYTSSNTDHSRKHPDDPETVALREDEEFASLNGISYTLPNLFGGTDSFAQPSSDLAPLPTSKDQSTPVSPSSEAIVRAELSSSLGGASNKPWWAPFSPVADSSPSKLYYIVLYLAPGDYHRFHSPTSWVCTSRRHFAGELYSVSPYLQRTLPGLFTLNERVVLLGRWRHGFFSYTPVGATNVGSIKINFDNELRTNSLLTDTEADRAAAAAKERGEPYCGYSEATYAGASKVLGGYALRRGEEVGGFQLGSSVVLVFEAPGGKRVNSLDTGGLSGGELEGGWKWTVERGQKVKVGQTIGFVQADSNTP